MKTLRASSGDGEVALNDVLDSAAPTVCAPGLDTEARDGPVNNGDVVAEHNPEHPTVEKRELRAWYSGDFASSVFHHVVTGAYLPLLMQQVALEKAGFPDECPNYATVRFNQSLSIAVFNTTVEDFFVDNEQTGKSACTTDCKDYQGNTYCEGVPAGSFECLSSSGYGRHKFANYIGDWRIDPTEYVFLFLGFSVLFQAVGFLLFGALGDYGGLRKQVYAVTTWVGSAALVCCIAVNPDRWWLGGVLLIISNLFFGISVLMYNAWLPLLVEAHPIFRALSPTTPTEERRKVYDDLAGSMSATGTIYGLGGGLLCLIITLPVAFAINSEDAFRANVVIAGVWWFFFSLHSIIYLKKRPGPPLPVGTSYAKHSVKEFWTTIRRLKQLASTAKFLFCWFLFSDGVGVIGATAVLFANTEVDWGCIPKVLGITVLLIGTPIFAILGLIIADRQSKKRGWEPKWVIIGSLCIISLVPIYGLIGFATDDFGFHHGWEMFVGMVFFATPVGVVFSYSRSYFANVIPSGYESQFFSIFELTDKGSAIVSPIIVSQIAGGGSDFRYVFIYELLMLLIPIALLIPLDPQLAHEQANAYAIKHVRSLDKRSSNGTPEVDDAGLGEQPYKIKHETVV